jgi:hypothetical protein
MRLLLFGSHLKTAGGSPKSDEQDFGSENTKPAPSKATTPEELLDFLQPLRLGVKEMKDGRGSKQ